MNIKYLLPNRYKSIGWILFIPGLILGLYVLIYESEPSWLTFRIPSLFYGNFTSADKPTGISIIQFIENNLLNEGAALLLLTGSLILIFSREPDEDEFTMKLRLESLLWSTIVYAAILAIALVLIYDVLFFQFMIVQLFLLFILMIGRFHWVMFKYRKEASSEKFSQAV